MLFLFETCVVYFHPYLGKWSSFTNICSNGESISPFIGDYNPSYPCSIQFLGGYITQLHLFLLGVYRFVGFFFGGGLEEFCKSILGCSKLLSRGLGKRDLHPERSKIHLIACYGWWRRKSSDHQLRLVKYPIVYTVFYIPGGCLGFLNHQLYLRKVTSYIIAWTFFHFVEGLAGLPALKSDEGPGLS